MINREFLEELELGDEIIEEILRENEETAKREKKEADLKEEINASGAYDAELVAKLIKSETETEGEESETLEKLKEKYPFLFQNTKLPQIVSPTKNSSGLTADEFGKMGYKKRTELYKKNPTLYKKLANM